MQSVSGAQFLNTISLPLTAGSGTGTTDIVPIYASL